MLIIFKDLEQGKPKINIPKYISNLGQYTTSTLSKHLPIPASYSQHLHYTLQNLAKQSIFLPLFILTLIFTYTIGYSGWIIFWAPRLNFKTFFYSNQTGTLTLHSLIEFLLPCFIVVTILFLLPATYIAKRHKIKNVFRLPDIKILLITLFVHLALYIATPQGQIGFIFLFVATPYLPRLSSHFSQVGRGHF